MARLSLSSECFRKAPSKIDETRTGRESREDTVAVADGFDGEPTTTAAADEDDLGDARDSVHDCEEYAVIRLEDVGDREDLNPQ